MFPLIILNLAGLIHKGTMTSVDQSVMQHSICQSIHIQKLAVFHDQWKERGHLVSASWLFKPGQYSLVLLDLLFQSSSGRMQKGEEELNARCGCSDIDLLAFFLVCAQNSPCHIVRTVSVVRPQRKSVFCQSLGCLSEILAGVDTAVQCTKLRETTSVAVQRGHDKPHAWY